MKLSTVLALSALGMASFASADRVVPSANGRTLQKTKGHQRRHLQKENKEKNNKDNKDNEKGGGGGGDGGDAGGEAGGTVPGCETGTGTCYAKNACDGGATLVPIWLCMDSCFETADGIMFVYVLGGVTPAEGCNPGDLNLPGGRKLRHPASAAKKEMASIVAPNNNRQFTRQEITISNEKTILNPLK